MRLWTLPEFHTVMAGVADLYRKPEHADAPSRDELMAAHAKYH